MTSHWDAIRRHWDLLGPPLRPPAEAVEAYRRSLRPHDGIVMLGVTPELAAIGRELVAIDQSPEMIAGIWPGDTDTRRAVVGDWLEMPMARDSVMAIIGDGCLSALGSSRERRRLLAEIARTLRPGGRAVIRTFASPEMPEDLAAVRTLAMAGAAGTFHALKWRIAMTCAAADPDRAIPVATILEAFDRLFPDRQALAAATGWPFPVIGTIDVYAHSKTAYSFATLAMLTDEAANHFGGVEIKPTGRYPLAERCPLLVMTRPRKPRPMPHESAAGALTLKEPEII
jgi:SAM-dependent methyltransferase